jgi:hypothetical protein
MKDRSHSHIRRIARTALVWLLTAAMLLRQAGIGYRKAYSLSDSGAPEELRL